MLKNSLLSGWFKKRMQPVAFSQDLQQFLMSIKLAGLVIALYSVETQKL